MSDQKAEQKTFKARYEVGDGYVGSRPQNFTIRAEDLDEDMTDSELETLYEDMCQEHMQEHIVCATSRVDEFVEWAREVLAARTQESRHD